MPRLTRVERQALTRADILEAARRRFLEHGYASTTLEDIAEDAGYSKGAVYSNFPDKPTLCRAVLEAVHVDKLREMTTIATSATDALQKLHAMEGWLERTVGDVGWTMLELEFAVISRGRPALAAMISDLHGGMHATVAAALESVATRPLPPEDGLPDVTVLADTILATVIGLGVQRAVDPSVAITPAVTAVRSALAVLIPDTEFPPSLAFPTAPRDAVTP